VSDEVRVEVDKASLQRMMRKLSAYPAAMKRVRRRVISKSVTWVQSQAVRKLARINAVPLKVLRGQKGRGKRVFVKRPSYNESSGSVWLGTLPVKAIYVGKPRVLKRKGGVRIGKHYFAGAFLATMPSGHTGIFKRKGEARLPIQEQFVKLEGVDQVADDIRIRLPVRMTELMRQELRFELSKVN